MTIIVSTSQPFDDGLNFLGLSLAEFADMTVTVQTATTWALEDDDGETSTFTGTFTAYDAEGFPTGGTITQMEFTDDGGSVLISDFEIAVEDFLDWIDTGDESAFFQALLAAPTPSPAARGPTSSSAWATTTSCRAAAGSTRSPAATGPTPSPAGRATTC